MTSSRGIFPTQGSNPGLPHCRRILYLVAREAYVPGAGKYYVPGTAMEVLRSCDRPAVEYYSAVICGELLINSTIEMNLKITKLNKRIHTL